MRSGSKHNFYHSKSLHIIYLFNPRIKIQDKVRALKRYPREEDRNTIATEREQLRTQLDAFALLAAQIGQRAEVATQPVDTAITAFDELELEPGDEERPLGDHWPEPATPGNMTAFPHGTDGQGHLLVPAPEQAGNAEDNALPPGQREVAGPDIFAFLGPPENLTIALPSSAVGGNHVLAPIELDLRRAQAERQLQELRELIAEKSFLYSHVIRVAPRKAVRTRARTNIAKHNISIVHLCRSYMRTRSALLLLGAPSGSHPILLKEHVKASTAILDPNLPGASRLQLSWIWQTTGDQTTTTESLLECM